MNKVLKYAGASGAALLPVAALAGSPYDPLTTAVDFGTVSTALIAVGATVIGVLITIRAVQWIKSGVKR